MCASTLQSRRTIRTASFNNAATAELLRKLCKCVTDPWLANELEGAAVQLEIDSDALDAVATNLLDGGFGGLP